MMRSIYSLFILCYTLGIKLGALFNSKAALWVNGRKNWKKKLITIDFAGKDVYWFHCSSLGEFEQGRPLIEAIKKHRPECFILLTFFSPSGFEQKKNYNMADCIIYLPADTTSNATYFIQTIKPKAVFFVKYEFWFNYLKVLETNKINTYLVSGIFRHNHYFFKWYGKWAARQLKVFKTFFVQDKNSLALLAQLGYFNTIKTGDTRFDRVIEIAEAKRDLQEMDNFSKGTKLIVAGSTWPEDEEILFGLWNYAKKNDLNLKFVIAPHEVSRDRINNMVHFFGETNIIKYSSFSGFVNNETILIIDNIGLLSSLYRYGHVCYVGGGFGIGIHNVLEAAVYGKPILFGPHYHKFREAIGLLKNGAAYNIQSSKEIIEITTKMLEDQALYDDTCKAASNFVKKNAGATNIISQYIFNS